MARLHSTWLPGRITWMWLPEPLLLCVASNLLLQVQALLTEGADVDAASIAGDTPLTLAVQADHAAVVLALCRTGAAAVNKPARAGVTPLWLAASLGRAQMVSLLSNLGADVNQPDHAGVSPACISATNGHSEVLRVLQANGKGPSSAGMSLICGGCRCLLG